MASEDQLIASAMNAPMGVPGVAQDNGDPQWMLREIARATDPKIKAALQTEYNHMYAGAPASAPATSMGDGFPELHGQTLPAAPAANDPWATPLGDAKGATAANDPWATPLDMTTAPPKPGVFARAAAIAQDPDGGLLPAAGSLVSHALGGDSAPSSSGGVLSTLADVGRKAIVGVNDLGESAVGLGDLVSGGTFGKFLADQGYDPKAGDAIINGYNSQAQQQSEANVANAKGFVGTLAALAVNPRAIFGGVVEALPGMAMLGVAGATAAGAVVRAAMPDALAAAKAAGLTGDAAAKFATDQIAGSVKSAAQAATAGALGAQTAGSVAEAGRASGQDYGTYAPAALAAGLATLATSYGSKIAAQALGVGDLATDLATGAAKTTGNTLAAGGKEFVKGAAENAAFGAVQGAGTNVATGQPWDTNLGGTTAEAGLIGGVMAGAHGLVSHSGATPDAVPPTADVGDAALGEAVHPLQGAVDAYLQGTAPEGQVIADIRNAPTVDDAITAMDAHSSAASALLAATAASRDTVRTAANAQVDADNAAAAVPADVAPADLLKPTEPLAVTAPAVPASAAYADLTPMDERTAQGRLTAMRGMQPAAGDESGLNVVPHPGNPEKFAIGRVLTAEPTQAADEIPAVPTQVGQEPTHTDLEAGAPPKMADVVAALKTDPALRTPEQRITVDAATRSYAPADMTALQKAATAPFSMGAAERVRLSELKASESRDTDEHPTDQVLAGAGRESGESIVRTNTGALPDQAQAKNGELSKQSFKVISQIARVFGKKLVVYEGGANDGFIKTNDPKTIYLNRSSSVPHLVVFGHELLHTLKIDSPTAYDALRKTIALKDGADLDVKGIRGDTEELTADLLGNRFKDPAFWADTFREILKNPDQPAGRAAAMKLGAVLTRTVNKLVRALGGIKGFDTDGMVSNLDEVKAAATKALADYARDRYGAAQELDAETKPSEVPSGEATVETHGESVPAEAPVVKGPPSRADKQAAAGAEARKQMGMRFSEQRGPIDPEDLKTSGTDKDGNDYDITIHKEMLGDQPHSVYVKAEDADGKLASMADFNVRADGKLAAGIVKTDPDSQRRGLGEMLYRAAKNAGYEIAGSGTYTEAGKKFVDGLRDKGVITASEKRDESLPEFQKGLGHQVTAGVEYGKMLGRQHEWQHNVGDTLLSTATGKTYELTARSFARTGKLSENNWQPTYLYKSSDGEQGRFTEKAIADSKTLKNLTTPQLKESERRGDEDVEPKGSALLNVGLDVSHENGGGRLTPDEVKAAIAERGAEVTDHTIHQSGTEPTMVARLNRPLEPDELHGLSARLRQDAIAQRTAEGEGHLEGPKAAEWGGAYNPDYFLRMNGQTDASQADAAVPKTDRVMASARRDELKPEVVQALGKHIKNLTPDERVRLRGDTAQKLVDTIAQLPSANEMAAVAYAGRAKRGWYAHSAAAMEHVFGADAPRFAALLAALSPQTGVEDNLKNALNTWKNWTAAGRPTDRATILDVLGDSVQGNKGKGSVLGAWENNSVRALSHDDPGQLKLSGPKVNSFMKNLVGDTDEVTNDTWMANYALVSQKIFAGNNALDKITGEDLKQKGAGYMAMSAQVRAAAKALTKYTGEEWTPSEVQETIWSWAKTLYESASVDKSAAEIVKDKGLTNELLNSTPDFRTLFHTDANERVLRDAGYGDELSSLRSRGDLGGAGAETSEPDRETAPFAADAQQRYELRAAGRLDALRARGTEPVSDDVRASENRGLSVPTEAEQDEQDPNSAHVKHLTVFPNGDKGYRLIGLGDPPAPPGFGAGIRLLDVRVPDAAAMSRVIGPDLSAQAAKEIVGNGRTRGSVLGRVDLHTGTDRTPARDNIDMKASASRIVDDNSDREYTDEQKRAFANTGRVVDVPSLADRVRSLRTDIGRRVQQGIVDQFAPIKDLTKDGYLLARLSKGAAGAFDAFLNHGKLSLDGGVYDADTSGGVIDRVFKPLGHESGDFLWWIAGNRAERLSAEGRENLFSPEDIAAYKSLDKGLTKNPYTLANGQVTQDRSKIYPDALRQYNEFNRNALDMAEQSGLVDATARRVWENEMYVPFYRVAEDQGGFLGNRVKDGLVRQQAFQQLKGGKDKLNSDLLQNTLQNWSHLIDASAKNRAARSTLEAAAAMGAAVEAPASTIAEMGKAGGNAVWFLDNGTKRSFLVDDPHLLAAISSLESVNSGPVMKALSTFKHWLTVGATASPAFKVRHLIRGSMTAMANSDTSLNPIANAIQGFRTSDPHSQTYVSNLASGGLFHFGSMLDGDTAANVRKLVSNGVDHATILDSDEKMKTMFVKAKQAFDKYNEFSNRGEEMPRTALYAQLRAKGVSHAEASLQARDLLDYSLQGSWPAIRMIAQTVPFMNARAQGLYKLGRSAVENPARMAAVLGALSLASVSLMAANSDDKDMQKREDFDVDNFWGFKIGSTIYRIPKPFELGAAATLAERTVQAFTDPEMTRGRLLNILSSTIGNQLNMNPVPQAVKPILDLYANKDGFTGRPIETDAMQKMQPDQRYGPSTSLVARGASSAVQATMDALGLTAAGVQGLSPVQIDHLVGGYFGWLGSSAVTAADMITRPMTDVPAAPTPDYLKMATGQLAAQADSGQSRYITEFYNQAKVLQQALGTYQTLVREGKVDEARAFMADNVAQIQAARAETGASAEMARLNSQVRKIQNDPTTDADTKRERINALRSQESDLAEKITASAR